MAVELVLHGMAEKPASQALVESDEVKPGKASEENAQRFAAELDKASQRRHEKEEPKPPSPAQPTKKRRLVTSSESEERDELSQLVAAFLADPNPRLAEAILLLTGNQIYDPEEAIAFDGHGKALELASEEESLVLEMLPALLRLEEASTHDVVSTTTVGSYDAIASYLQAAFESGPMESTPVLKTFGTDSGPAVGRSPNDEALSMVTTAGQTPRVRFLGLGGFRFRDGRLVDTEQALSGLADVDHTFEAKELAWRSLFPFTQGSNQPKAHPLGKMRAQAAMTAPTGKESALAALELDPEGQPLLTHTEEAGPGGSKGQASPKATAMVLELPEADLAADQDREILVSATFEGLGLEEHLMDASIRVAPSLFDEGFHNPRATPTANGMPSGFPADREEIVDANVDDAFLLTPVTEGTSRAQAKMLLETYIIDDEHGSLVSDAAIPSRAGGEEGLTPSEDTEDGATSATVDRSNLLGIEGEAKRASPMTSMEENGVEEDGVFHKDFSSQRENGLEPESTVRTPEATVKSEDELREASAIKEGLAREFEPGNQDLRPETSLGVAMTRDVEHEPRTFDPKHGTRPISVTPRQVMEQIVKAVEFDITGEYGEVRLQLKPEHLGELQVKIATNNGVVSATFVAESNTVKSLIEAGLPQLKDQLMQQGLSIQDVSVQVGGGDAHSREPYPGRQAAAWPSSWSVGGVGTTGADLSSVSPMLHRHWGSIIDYRA